MHKKFIPFLPIVFIVFVPHSYVLAMALYHLFFFFTELHYIYALKTSWIVLAMQDVNIQNKKAGFQHLYKKNCLGFLFLFFIPSSSSSFFLCVVSSCCFFHFFLFLAFNSFWWWWRNSPDALMFCRPGGIFN